MSSLIIIITCNIRIIASNIIGYVICCIFFHISSFFCHILHRYTILLKMHPHGDLGGGPPTHTKKKNNHVLIYANIARL